MNKYIQLILVGLLSIGLFACSQDDGKAVADKAGAMAEEAGDAVEDAAVARSNKSIKVAEMGLKKK